MLPKFKLNRVEILISKFLIDSNISHGESVLIDHVLKEYDDMKEEIKSLKTYRKFESIYETMLSYCVKWRNDTESKNPKFVKTINGRIMLLSKCEMYDTNTKI